MRAFTASRNGTTPDELWLLTHPPVYTLGLNGDPAHILDGSACQIIKSDRGGQVTWHGPGQLVLYTLLDLKRLDIGIRAYVSLLENTIIQFLSHYGFCAISRPEAPGVYVCGDKIASIGLKVTQGRCYHGISLNVNPDLGAFDRINPCGYPGLKVTSLQKLGIVTSTDEVMPGIITSFFSQPPLASLWNHARF